MVVFYLPQLLKWPNAFATLLAMNLLMILFFSLNTSPGIMIVSCLYMCLCSRFIHVADDGHMRLRCCGKYVTGIGNVPKWDPPVRKALIKPDTDDADNDGN